MRHLSGKTGMKAERYRITTIFLAAALAMILWPAYAVDSSEITIITSPGCTKCAAAERALSAVLADFGNIPTSEYSFSSEEGHRIVKEHKVKDVPSIIIGDIVIGYRDYDGNETELKLLIRAALKGQDISRSNMDGEEDGFASVAESLLQDLTLSSAVTVFMAGLLAGFNPCLLAILAFLASTVLASSGRRRDLLTMIAFFSMGIFVVYYIFGVGLFNVLQEKSTAATFRLVLAAILLILGLMQMDRSGSAHIVGADLGLRNGPCSLNRIADQTR